MCPIGPERSLLEPSADACKRVFLDSPILCPEATVVLGGLMHRWADGWWGCKCKGGNETGGKVGRTFVFVSWDRWVVLCGRERGGDKLATNETEVCWYTDPHYPKVSSILLVKYIWNPSVLCLVGVMRMWFADDCQWVSCWCCELESS